MKKIMITAPVHQDAKIFKEYLWSLNRLIIPNGYIVDKYFYLHNADNLKKFLQPNEYEVFKDDTKVEHTNTHIWTQNNFTVVSKMRTKALERARELKYDYIFSVDSDTILCKTTLQELIEDNLPFVSKLHWTPWDSNHPEILGPNCYDGRNSQGQIIFFKSPEKYKIPGIYEVGSAGGCNLISSKIFNHPEINYYPIPILRSSFWEDFAFATRCKSVIPEIKFYIDTNNPVKHLYHKIDFDNWIKGEKEKWEKEF